MFERLGLKPINKLGIDPNLPTTWVSPLEVAEMVAGIQKVFENWENKQAARNGPYVELAIERLLCAINCLEGGTLEGIRRELKDILGILGVDAERVEEHTKFTEVSGRHSYRFAEHKWGDTGTLILSKEELEAAKKNHEEARDN